MAAISEQISEQPISIRKQPIVIYAFPGSQFTHKVLAAVESRKLHVPVYVTFVDLPNVEKRKQQLPSGGTLVPEMTVGSKGTSRVVVQDSEAILHWLDEHHGTNFFPTQTASELSKRASDHTLAAAVWYYNWVNKKGWERSLQRTFREVLLPRWFPKCLSNVLIDAAVKSDKQKFANKFLQAFPGANQGLLEDEPSVRRKLVEELKYFQSFLEPSKGTQRWLLQDSDQPTAADFSVYAQVTRLLGGGTSDSEIYACTPELRDEASLSLLWEWYDNMKENYFVEFRNRRPPKELLH